MARRWSSSSGPTRSSGHLRLRDGQSTTSWKGTSSSSDRMTGMQPKKKLSYRWMVQAEEPLGTRQKCERPMRSKKSCVCPPTLQSGRPEKASRMRVLTRALNFWYRWWVPGWLPWKTRIKPRSSVGLLTLRMAAMRHRSMYPGIMTSFHGEYHRGTSLLTWYDSTVSSIECRSGSRCTQLGRFAATTKKWSAPRRRARWGKCSSTPASWIRRSSISSYCSPWCAGMKKRSARAGSSVRHEERRR
mmetsp:Transcript_13630/g.40753  ORF Transcript_13630/g.40753 Transcript_13630/m.40753 type:complete len:244 (-) Transcript_13630:504-1235(-)